MSTKNVDLKYAYSSYVVWLQYDLFLSTGTLRGISEMGLGCICYFIGKQVKDRFKKSKIPLNSIVETLSLLYIMWTVWAAGPSLSDFVSVIFMSALITSVFMEKSVWSNLYRHWIFKFLKAFNC